MDTSENSDQVLQKLSGIERQLRSLRYIFGIGIIIMAVFLALLAPTLVRDFSFGNSWGAPEAGSSVGEMPAAEAPSTPPAQATTPATTTATTTP